MKRVEEGEETMFGLLAESAVEGTAKTVSMAKRAAEVSSKVKGRERA